MSNFYKKFFNARRQDELVKQAVNSALSDAKHQKERSELLVANAFHDFANIFYQAFKNQLITDPNELGHPLHYEGDEVGDTAICEGGKFVENIWQTLPTSEIVEYIAISLRHLRKSVYNPYVAETLSNINTVCDVKRYVIASFINCFYHDPDFVIKTIEDDDYKGFNEDEREAAVVEDITDDSRKNKIVIGISDYVLQPVIYVCWMCVNWQSKTNEYINH